MRGRVQFDNTGSRKHIGPHEFLWRGVVFFVQMAMLAGFQCTALRDAILAHPTMAEGLNALFSNVTLANKNTANNDMESREARKLSSSAV